MAKFTVGWHYEGQIEIEATDEDAARAQFNEMDQGAYLGEIATTEPALEIQFIEEEDDYCDDCGRNMTEGECHTADCEIALRQDAEDGDEEAQEILEGYY